MVAIIAPPYILLSVSFALLIFLIQIYEKFREILKLVIEVKGRKIPLFRYGLYIYVLLNMMLFLFSALEICVLEPKNEVVPIILTQSIQLPIIGNILILSLLFIGLSTPYLVFLISVMHDN